MQCSYAVMVSIFRGRSPLYPQQKSVGATVTVITSLFPVRKSHLLSSCYKRVGCSLPFLITAQSQVTSGPAIIPRFNCLNDAYPDWGQCVLDGDDDITNQDALVTCIEYLTQPGFSTLCVSISNLTDSLSKVRMGCTVRPRLSGHIGTSAYPDKWFGRIWEICLNIASSVELNIYYIMYLLIATLFVTNYHSYRMDRQ